VETFSVCQGSLSVVKRSGLEVHYSIISNDEFKNELSYASTGNGKLSLLALLGPNALFLCYAMVLV
jgi:hypothetical protein